MRQRSRTGGGRERERERKIDTAERRERCKPTTNPRLGIDQSRANKVDGAGSLTGGSGVYIRWRGSVIEHATPLCLCAPWDLKTGFKNVRASENKGTIFERNIGKIATGYSNPSPLSAGDPPDRKRRPIPWSNSVRRAASC
ncbi:uncharacterized protein LOC105203058 [Solenopsis invicta]|uniref:uncharacterized protein LOC105203058 n=1 Tax=Solenopsis invicta TaxID=13686 RepID=UPI00193CEEF0|nr:uncharacterized protein LOC105203058 [Solenopsis invicta]